VSKAADVYAFGITLWEVFTCGQPFEGEWRKCIICLFLALAQL